MPTHQGKIKAVDRADLRFQRLSDRAYFLLIFAAHGTMTRRDAVRLITIANKSVHTLPDYLTVNRIGERVIPYGYAGEARA